MKTIYIRLSNPNITDTKQLEAALADNLYLDTYETVNSVVTNINGVVYSAVVEFTLDEHYKSIAVSRAIDMLECAELGDSVKDIWF